MHDDNWLADAFENHRPTLRGVAYRMLGSVSEADDALQEAWLRLSHTDIDGVETLAGWLTTVVSRICLDMLRSRASRREELRGDWMAAPHPASTDDPEQEALLVDSVGLALLVVLDTLTPAERFTFVLHDMFGVSFQEIASILGGTPAAAKMRASRARRQIRAADRPITADRTRQREVINAFLAASRDGDFEALVGLLDPEIVVCADHRAVQLGAPVKLQGAALVAGKFLRRATAARLALINGVPGAVWAPARKPQGAFEFTISKGRIIAIQVIADPNHLRQLTVSLLAE